MKEFDYLIVGAGLSGCTMARLLTDSGKRVLVIEKRDHVGGNISTHMEEGIAIHDYGPHIFHTSYDDVWEFFNKYCKALPFINSPLANYNGRLFHMPFNMNTFHELWGVTTAEEAQAKIAEEVAKEGITDPKNLEEQAISLVGRTIYETLVKGYTEKQWGRDCTELPASIIKRLPLRFEYNNNYFNDIYQAIPEGGFQSLIDNLLEGIEVRVSCDYFANKDELDSLADKIIYTGLLDEYFGYSLGHLQYRSLRFETERMDIADFQHNAVVNYTTREPAYTRITEHKHFDSSCQNEYSTFVTYEYPDSYEEGKVPYYTINDDVNNALAEPYRELASTQENAYF
ncbi:MAG: UDP-galactopyranose mutase, partial [Bacilli bacterium]|nr:UDP-galactopyranose mutase [Bacilli bacterium]